MDPRGIAARGAARLALTHARSHPRGVDKRGDQRVHRRPGQRANVGLEHGGDVEGMVRELQHLRARVRRGGADHYPGRLEPRHDVRGEHGASCRSACPRTAPAPRRRTYAGHRSHQPLLALERAGERATPRAPAAPGLLMRGRPAQHDRTNFRTAYCMPPQVPRNGIACVRTTVSAASSAPPSATATRAPARPVVRRHVETGVGRHPLGADG